MVCSKCAEREARNGQRWCSLCHAEYMQGYRKLISTREVRAAKKEGQKEMREQIVKTFRHVGDRSMNGYTAAAMVEQMEG